MAVSAEAQISECEMSIQTTRLEKEYELVRAHSTSLLNTERDRVRRMEYLLLQFERDALRSQLDQANEQLLGATESERDARTQLEEAFQEIDRLDAHVQSSSSETNRLRDELSAMNDTSTSYSNLLAEKLRLSRDLTNHQNELDRLRNQDSSYQALIPEKQELERQLNSLEVQLENEKNSHDRTRGKISQQAAEIGRLSRVTSLENCEQNSNPSTTTDSKIQDGKANDQPLETKIETLKKQLRTAKDKLQEAQNELQHRRNNVRIENETSEPRSRTVPLQRPGPGGADYQGGVTISTPGAVRVQDKLKRQSALPGDKSAFSITPYLNRTKNSRGSPSSSDVEEEQPKKAKAQAKAKDAIKTVSRKPSIAEEPAAERASLEDRNSSTRVPSTTAKGKSRAQEGKPASRPAPKPILEEDSDDLESSLDQGQAKTKRRKLGAQRERSLFEDDEDEGGLDLRKPGRKLGLGGGRSSILATTTQMSGASGIPRNLGFAAPLGFSPLKKDRKRF
ncbi:hypothetical protein N7481_003458 [Penicillium waksmanii]|uniref:uncharacterized protein n=1 Tax=Penicillium waksmanii TaxID=69791 RepID=UPI00254836AF|nr:uncharacterized protein N7481_003458 [Penicillium waksmanii]KAJ5988248.1 hypothetical protein N7481_003458 [Penicillium waksmanii]